jgi:O-antigen/teichoic acid export membrane protein
MKSAPASADDTSRTINSRFLMLAAANVAGAAAGFLLLSVIGHASGAAALGQISVALSVLTYAQIVTNFGSDSFAIRAVVAGRAAPRALIPTVIASRLALCIPTLLVVSALCLAVPTLNDERAIIAILSVSVLASAILPLWAAQAFEQTGVVAICNLAGPVLNLALGVVAAVTDIGVLGYAVARVAADGLIAVVLLAWTLRRHGWGPWPQWSELVRFIRGAAPIGGSKLLNGVSLAGDLIIVDLFATAAANVGHYAAPARVYALVLTLSAMYFVIVLPIFSRAAARGPLWLKAEMTRSLIRTVPVALLGTGLLAFLARPLLYFGFGADFVGAAPILNLLMIAAVANLVSRTFGQALIAGGAAPAEMRATLIGVIVAICAKIGLSAKYGVTGAALATVGGELLLLLLQGRAVMALTAKPFPAPRPRLKPRRATDTPSA